MMYRSPVSDHRGSRSNLHAQHIRLVNQVIKNGALWTLVDEPKFAQKSHKTSVFELACQFSLETVNSARVILK